MLLVCSVGSLPIPSARASWNSFGSYDAADFYNAHLGLVGTDGQGGLIQKIVDGNLTGVFATGVKQIAIQDSNRAWATDGDSLYLGTNGWTNWRTAFGQSNMTLIRATPGALFVYSDNDLYFTVGDTMLTKAQGILYDDTITAIDYFSASRLVAVSTSNLYSHSLFDSSSNIYISTDGGENWTLVLKNLKGAASVFVDTAHHLVFTGGDKIRVSADSGMTWNIVQPPEEFGFTNFAGQVFGARDCSGTFYIANGAVNGLNPDLYRSQDDGITFDNVGAEPFTASFKSTIKGWVFDRGSMVILGYRAIFSTLQLSISHDGADGLIPDSVASAITVSADTIYDTICAVASVPFHVTVASSICAGVTIDAITVVKSSGTISKVFTTRTLFGNDTTFSLTYSGATAGTDSIVLRLQFHSVEWGIEEHIDFPVIAYSVAPPAELVTIDSLPFGNVQILTSKKLELPITNSGCSSLRVDSIVSSDPSIFSIARLSYPVTIKGGSSMNVAVTFSPQVAGPALEAIELGTSAGHTFIEVDGQGTTILNGVADENTKQADFSVFPNPANSFLSVHGVCEHLKYEIIDLLGRTILSGRMDGQTIDIAAVPEGMYVLRCGALAAHIMIARK